MFDTQNPEDRLIRTILLGAATAAILGFLATATAIAVMISANFNPLNWLE